MTTTNHLRELAAKLRRAGATVPLGENKGTIESAMQHGLSIALVVTEEMAERVEKEDSISSRIQELEERVASAAAQARRQSTAVSSTAPNAAALASASLARHQHARSAGCLLLIVLFGRGHDG